jgi:hypothetical protein
MIVKTKDYRVVTDNCVLGYFHTESSACEYIDQLKDHSPLVASECYAERRGCDDRASWSKFLTVSQQFHQACEHARANKILCFKFDGVTFLYSRTTRKYHVNNNAILNLTAVSETEYNATNN